MRISEGMGNQLFQYALGRNLSKRIGTEMKFETSYFLNGSRKYALEKFNIPEASIGIATNSDFKSVGLPDMHMKGFFSKVQRKLFGILESSKPISERKFVIEPYFQFCPDILSITGNAFLSGVWQSEKYFKDSADAIRKDLTLKEPLSSEAKMWSERMENTTSVSLHIRRGDYIKSKKTHQFHGVCAPGYYQEAVIMIARKVKNLNLYVFSDDIEWAKVNLKSPYPISFVSCTGLSDAEELFLMSKCKHNIIANSSFSWWGAWLNENKNKIVVAPRKWFNESSVVTKDLIPNTWTTI